VKVDKELLPQVSQTHKKCPFCAEDILVDAVKCKHCGEFLNDSARQPVQAQSQIQSSGANKFTVTGILLHAIAWLGIAMLLFWVAESPLITAGNHLGTTLVIVIVGSALLIALDANQLGIGTGKDPKTGKNEGGPITWFIGTLLLWLILYPRYMFKRARYGASGSGVACLVGALLFTGISVYTTNIIEEKRSEIRGNLDRSMSELEDLRRRLQ
jgi:FtsH-binding integral membrane protein